MFTSHSKPLLNRCVRRENPAEDVITRTGLRNYFQEVSEDLEACYMEMLWLCVVAFVFSLLTLVMLRFIPGLIVWLVLLAVVVVCTVGTIWLWVKWNYETENMPEAMGEGGRMRVNNYLYYAIAATVATLLVYLVILVMRKRIKLVVQLFREAGKAISNMPFLLLEPILVKTIILIRPNNNKLNYYSPPDIHFNCGRHNAVHLLHHVDRELRNAEG